MKFRSADRLFACFAAFACVAATSLSCVPQALSQQEASPQSQASDTPGAKPAKSGGGAAPISSEDSLTLGQESAPRLRAQGEMALKSGQIGLARKALEKSVRLNPNDVDARSAYARALQEEWNAGTPRDPAVFNECVKQWLWVCRKAEFPDQSGEARSQLKALTGKTPKVWEPGSKYLDKVLLPENVPVVASPKSKKPKKRSGDDIMFMSPQPGMDSVR